MIKNIVVSHREKVLFVAAGIVLGLLIIGAVIGLNNSLWSSLSTKKVIAQKEWQYNSAVLSRGPFIEANLNGIRSRFSRLFEASQGAPRVMVELDEIAANSGVRVDLIRPVQRDTSDFDQYEMTLRGSWLQVMTFLSEVESPEHAFSVPTIHIKQRDNSGELFVSVDLNRASFE